MKRNLAFALVPLVLVCGCKKESVNVYLIMGQSNASGCSPCNFLEESNPDIYKKYSKGNKKVQISWDVIFHAQGEFEPTKFGQADGLECFGPEIGIAEVLSSHFNKSYIVKGTLSGSCLQTNYVDKDGNKLVYYNHFVSFIKDKVEKLEKMGKIPRICGVFWMQGESDSTDELCNTYGVATQYFRNYLLEDFSPWINDHFNFVDAYISTKSIFWKNPGVVNAGKQYVADNNPNSYCIKTNGEDETSIDLSLKCQSDEGDDAAHYDSKSMLLLGKTAGEYLIK